MRLDRYLLHAACVLTLCTLLSVTAKAQTDSGTKTDTNSGDTEETQAKFGEYVASGSVEFGYRFTDVRGAKFPCGTSASGRCQDESMYNTFVNLHTGPRVMEQTLFLQAPAGSGGLFDHLYVNSFGWGGDPNQLGSLRISKAKIYNLTVNYRRDQNFFNYDLLANPLNLGTLNPNAPVLQGPNNISLTPGLGTNQFLVSSSPHWFSTARRMTDVDLTIAPQSAISLRLGYSRVRNDGLSGWTYHMSHGTDINPTTNNDNTSDLYRLGLDFRVLPKTTISYDQFYTHNRMGVIGTDPNRFFSGGGVPTDLGISWNLPANQPCTAGNLASVTGCNQATNYLLNNRYRASIITEQLSVQSHPNRRIDISLRGMYSHTHQDGNWSQFWTGLAGTPGSAAAVGNGLLLTSISHNRRNEGSADLGFTVHLTEKLRLVDNARWYNWRIESLGFLGGTAFNPGASSQPVTSSLVLSVTGPTGITGCATFPCLFPLTLKEETKENEASIEYDFTRMFGARIGYRYADRLLFDTDEVIPATSEGAPAPGDVETGQDRASVTGHTGLAGFWIRWNQRFRLSADGEFTSNQFRTGGGDTGIDPNTNSLGPIPRIVPQHEQQYRVRSSYTPRSWAVISASLNFRQASNRVPNDNYDFHNYNGGFAVSFIPNKNYGVDLAYNYNSYSQSNLICPVGLVAGVPIGSTVLNTVCPDGPGLYQTFGKFESINHFISAMVRAKVLPRVTTAFGYSLSNSDGSQLFTDLLLVPGSLKNSFHRPLASIEIELIKHWTLKGGWNYYGYNEKGPAGPSLPRDFHANNGTVSLKYAF